ncbi:coiled-coil domain-containing protein 180 [Eublepharis macularius]|uniref:Coiled-coil domain-containing protein 180 n=1 Tax=Eublepharis macularius TaxID=481883 RepID=A0AA97KBG6_EUBMA|nr:coiled-coil domain-containing protein 180 [Eublepharis macularius]
MTLVGVSRVVPSGKIYRQIFDDEINLVRTLGEARSKLAQHKSPQNPGRIPLVRHSERCSGNGFLSHRQQMWVEGMPNDDFTENPVLYKEATMLALQKEQESENMVAAREVRGLAEVIIPEKKSSDIIERLSKARKRRHEDAVAALRQDLASVGRERELSILEPGKLFLTKLARSDKNIECLFQRIENDSSFESYSMQDFEEVWDLVSRETLQRKQWIRELDRALHKAEAARTELIKGMLKKYTKILEDTAYLLPSDVHRFIHNEAMMINQALLANRRAIARLFVNLMEADLKKDVFFRRKLEEGIQIWKTTQKQFIACSFRKFMEDERIQNPSIVKKELKNMLKDQLSLSEKRMALLYSLGNLLPLTHSKAEINECYESTVALNKRIDTHNVQYMMRIRIQYEKVCQECLSYVQECKKKLLEKRICTEEEAEKMINPSFFQLIGKVQRRFENEVEMMDNDFEQLAKHTEINCRHLYQYFQDALVLWDVHQRNLTQEENDLHSKLNDLRNKHENMNKLREVNLDISIDKLRTQSSDEKLKAQLEKVYAVLDFIRAGYEAFHHDLETKITAYPQNVLKELIFYSALISQYFNVKETYEGKPIRKASVEEEEEEEEEMAADADKAEDAGEIPGSLESLLEHESKDGEQHSESAEEQAEHKAATESEQEKLGEMESFPPESGRTESWMSLGLVSNMTEKSEEGSEVREDGDVLETAEMTAPTLGSELTEPSERILECFNTSSGNTYTVLEHTGRWKTKKSEKYYVGKLKEDTLPLYLQQVFLSQIFIENVRRQIRLQFFEHLEKWFAQSLSTSWTIMASKKEELNAELQLRIHLHEPRRERIEKDVFYVRMAELRFHKERLERHCAGVLEALNQEKAAFQKLKESQNQLSKNFRQRIQDMEIIFLTESCAEKLLSLSNNLHMELLNHVEVIQVSLRSYRQYLEEALGKLREANTDFLKACRFFSEGGNFSPEELDRFTKGLQKENGRIDFVEGLIMIDMEKMESSHLEQATEIIGKFENKFHYLAVDRVFIEKIQRFMTNIQVKIKLEVEKSNVQNQTLNSHLEKLVSRIDACAHPNVDKESITSEELYESARFVMEKMKERSKYLNCLLGLDFALPPPEASTQSSTGGPSQSGSFQQDGKAIVMGVQCTPLMTPSRMGKAALDDAAIGVIKQLTGMQRSKKTADQQHEKEDRLQLGAGGSGTGGSGAGGGSSSGGGGVLYPIPTFPAVASGTSRGEPIASPAGQNTMSVSAKKSISFSKRLSVAGSNNSIQKYIKQTKGDKKFLIFGDKPKDSDYTHFKGIIFCIVWDNFDVLMTIAEDFYKKDKHQITRPEYLQETYDQCVDVMGQKLLLYLEQTDDYHNTCISEFRDQLRRFEGLLPEIAQLLTGKLLKDQEQLLIDSTEQIRRDFQEQLQKWDIVKDKNKNKLRPTLGHPDNLPQLQILCQEEEERQNEQTDGIHLCTQKLKACAIECAQRFISTLATCTEKILMELDDSLTVDDVQMGKTETPREKTSTLIRRKKAGLSLAVEECKLLAERGSRTWPGIPRTTLVGLPDQILCQETAAITTTKTTLGHVAAVKERDAVYMKFKQVLEAEFARIKEGSTAHLMKAQHWADWWKKSVQKIKQLYS